MKKHNTNSHLLFTSQLSAETKSDPQLFTNVSQLHEDSPNPSYQSHSALSKSKNRDQLRRQSLLLRICAVVLGVHTVDVVGVRDEKRHGSPYLPLISSSFQLIETQKNHNTNHLCLTSQISAETKRSAALH